MLSHSADNTGQELRAPPLKGWVGSPPTVNVPPAGNSQSCSAGTVPSGRGDDRPRSVLIHRKNTELDEGSISTDALKKQRNLIPLLGATEHGEIYTEETPFAPGLQNLTFT